MKKEFITDEDKIKQTHEALQMFTNQFGEFDIFAESLFEILLGAFNGNERDDILIPGEEKQEISENNKCDRIREMPTYEIE